MTPDTAEMAIVEAPLARGALAQPAAVPSLGLRSSDRARREALHDTWRALLLSRALVWIAGIGTVATLGFGPTRGAFDPPRVTRGFGWLGDLLAAPVARWDSAWYLVIAHFGYMPQLGSFTSARDAFFPLYPMGLGALAAIGIPPVLAGVVISLAAFALALYGLHRITSLELGGHGVRGGGEVARLAVLVTALAPMAFYFSAVYSESLYLALSVGVFWCARQGRWAWVGILGALAAGTRSTGVVLLLPAAMLYLYGPREDRPTDLGPAPGAPAARPCARRGPALGSLLALVRPRYRLRGNVAWLGLIPAGILLYMVFLGLSGGDTFAPFHSQQVWGRHFAGPYLGVWDGARAAFEGARQLLSGQSTHVYFPIAAGSPSIAAGHNLMLFAFLLLGITLLIGVVRILPAAYGAYVIAALALPLSYPVAAQPLMSLPRFLVALFPLSMVLAAWLAARPRWRAPALVVSALTMMFFVAQFATWHWVA